MATRRLLLASFFLMMIGESTSEDPTVQTSLGKIKGLQLTDPATGETVYQFRGIRYGKSTEGDRRFRKPEKVDSWTETYQATKFGAACPQLSIGFIEEELPETSEDCLFLNVYVPRSLDKKRSVMVWIHGGGLVVGHSHYYDGTRIAVDGDVVFVSINYRLGVFGFMSLNHPEAKGNYGLWDQKLALQWVHDYIADFNGDPESVTIFGESAGGWSVSCQSLIPSNEGLFQRVIAQSGVLARTGMLQNKAVDDFFTRVSKRTNCSASDATAFVDCLRSHPVDLLLQATDFWQDVHPEGISVEFMIGIAIDGELFPDHPLLLLDDPFSAQSKFFRSLDFIAGTVEQEGSLLYMELMPQITELYKFDINEGVPNEFICKGIVKPFVDMNYKGDQSLIDKICKFYCAESELSRQALQAADAYADIIFTPATAEMLNFHSKLGGRTYQYLFSRLNPKPFGPPPPPWFKTNGHADELIFLFHIDEEGKGGFFDVKMSDVDLKVSKAMIRYWTTFAKTGVPTGGENDLPWLEYDSKKRIYIDINEDTMLKQNAKGKNVKFWLEEIPPPDLRTSYVLHDEL